MLGGIASPDSMSDSQFQQLLDTVPPGEGPTFLDDLMAEHPGVDIQLERMVEDGAGVLAITRVPTEPMSLRQLFPSVQSTSAVHPDGSIYIELDGETLLYELLNEEVDEVCDEQPTTYPSTTYPVTTTTYPVTTTTYPPCPLVAKERTELREAFYIFFGLTLPYPIAATNGELDDEDSRLSVTWGPLEYGFDLEYLYAHTESPDVALWRYPDVEPDYYAAESVYWAVDQGIMETYSVIGGHRVQSERFVPWGGVKKTDALEYLRRFNRLLECPDSPDAAPGSASYPDIPLRADGAVGWAIHHNIAGTDLLPPSCFHFDCDPDSLVNRGTAVLYLSRVSTLVGGPTLRGWGHEAFTDVTRGLHYDEAIGWAAANDIARGLGDGRFLPSVPATRGDLAAFMHRLYQKVLAERSLTGE